MSKEKTDFVVYLFNLESCLLFKVWNVLVLLCSSQWLSAQQLAIVATTLNRMAPSVWFRARHTKHETQIKYSPPICQILRNFTEGKARKVTVSFAFCAHIIVIKYRKKNCRLPSSAHRLLEWWECWSIARHEVVIIPTLKLMFLTQYSYAPRFDLILN